MPEFRSTNASVFLIAYLHLSQGFQNGNLCAPDLPVTIKSASNSWDVGDVQWSNQEFNGLSQPGEGVDPYLKHHLN